MKFFRSPAACAILSFSCMLGQPLLADGVFAQFTYTEDETSVTITDYPEDATGPAKIPPTIAGKPVTAIGAGAFRNCTEITKVTIPGSVVTIGNSAFEFCESIKSVKLEEGLQVIGARAFGGSPGISEITFPSTLTTIGQAAFQRTSSPMRRAVFLGNAPLLGPLVFKVAKKDPPPGFLVCYLATAEGFTTPVWNGYPVRLVAEGISLSVSSPNASSIGEGGKTRFGDVLVGQRGGPKILTINNLGTKTLTGLKVTVDGANPKDFKVTQPNKTTISAGESRVFKVTFTPTGISERLATISIRTNESPLDPYDFQTAGQGVGIR